MASFSNANGNDSHSQRNVSFQERFKDQIQTIGKGGIIGTFDKQYMGDNSNSNNSKDAFNYNEYKVIHHTAYGGNYNNVNTNSNKGKLKPIKTNNKPKTEIATQNNELNIQQQHQHQQQINTNTNINLLPQQQIINPQYQQPQQQPYYQYPPQQQYFNNNNNNNNYYQQGLIYNPYYQQYQPSNGMLLAYQQQQPPYTPYIINNNNNSNLNTQQQAFPSKPKLRPISSQTKHIPRSTTNNNLQQNALQILTNNNNSHISHNTSSRICSAQSRSRISNIEYRPYTLKEYKELEKVGVVLGGLGPNIGTKEWEEKKEKMKKMEEYASRIANMKSKIKKKKDNLDDILTKEKQSKIDNSIRQRCLQYGNLIRPRTRTADKIKNRPMSGVKPFIDNSNMNNNNNNIIEQPTTPNIVVDDKRRRILHNNNNNTHNSSKYTINCDVSGINSKVDDIANTITNRHTESRSNVYRPNNVYVNKNSNRNDGSEMIITQRRTPAYNVNNNQSESVIRYDNNEDDDKLWSNLGLNDNNTNTNNEELLNDSLNANNDAMKLKKIFDEDSDNEELNKILQNRQRYQNAVTHIKSTI